MTMLVAGHETTAAVLTWTMHLLSLHPSIAARVRADVGRHVRDIQTKYLLAGETQDTALLFVPSEAVYADLQEHFGDIVQKASAARVLVVSPSLLMLAIQVMQQILKDARMREQAGAIRKELAELYKDVERLGTRVENLDRHFGQAAKDIEEIKISSEKATKRARRLDNFDFEELGSESVPLIPPRAAE